MSGIYIPGMEMPTSCSECFSHYDGYCQASIDYADTDNFPSHREINRRTYGERREDFCPLIPVPDHGRLIDADALMDALPDDFRIPSAAAKVIERTIIPADRADKEGD